MKICRFNDDRLGVVDGEEVIDVTGALEVIPKCGWPAPVGDALIANLDAVCAKASALAPAGERHALSAVVLKSPVANPNKVIGAPVNYYAHQDEAIADKGVNFGTEIKTIDHYGLFLKNSVLVGAGEGVDLHFTDRRNDHEVEVSLIIGKTAQPAQGYRQLFRAWSLACNGR
jgi:2-keto-4-pentenoate hydratase/2-oxohepta-3-ene-1,7-dioic acid hydratase in catechol pathway